MQPVKCDIQQYTDKLDRIVHTTLLIVTFKTRFLKSTQNKNKRFCLRCYFDRFSLLEQNTFRTNLSHCLSLSCITTLKTILSYDNCSESIVMMLRTMLVMMAMTVMMTITMPTTLMIIFIIRPTSLERPVQCLEILEMAITHAWSKKERRVMVELM